MIHEFDSIPTWATYFGVFSPRGSASVSTLVRRMAYGGRKGRRASKRLGVLVTEQHWPVGIWTVGIGTIFAYAMQDMTTGETAK
jgi:hypothetical protein